MAAASVLPTRTVADVVASENGFSEQGVPGVDLLQIQNRYGEERAKRLHEKGNNQFLDLSIAEKKFQKFLEDPFVIPAKVKDLSTQFPNDRCEVLVIGAGWAGLLYAVRMVDAGVRPEDIRLIDPAGGFGGTWYWNRYPGIGCDIESYCYLPLLEETGYVPKHRYSYGEEIRQYAELVAKKWGLADSGVFQTKATKLEWDEESKEWKVELEQTRKGQKPQTTTVRATSVSMNNGVLSWPKLPSIPGILDFKGDFFHTSRWNYDLTGGAPGIPELYFLKNKRVAIVGTGATSIQAVPHLAKWSKHLYVVQRTPSAVDYRGQRETDDEWFKKNVATHKGWQYERMVNLYDHLSTGKLPEKNLVDDSWTRAHGMAIIAGNPDSPSSMEEIPAYLEKVHKIDAPRQHRVRLRAEQEVKDPAVAKKLQAWYPTWCKRPTFHDEYLNCFNQDNVTLVDTDGKGLDRLTKDSIVVGDQSYPVDIIVWATGFRAPFTGTPAEKGNLTITGRNGISISKEWEANGPKTQHGIIDHNFPNLFLSGPWQASLGPNYLFTIATMAKEAAYIHTEAKRRANGKPFAVNTTLEGAENWGMQVLMHAAGMAAIAGCTPGYFNVEGEADKVPEELQMKFAKSAVWGHGGVSYVKVLGDWMAEGKFSGLEVRT